MQYSKIETKDDRVLLEIADKGRTFTISTQNRLLRLLMPNSVTGVSILNCRDDDPENEIELVPFAQRVIDYFPSKNVSFAFRGSSNQRIIDLKKTKETGKLQLLTV